MAETVFSRSVYATGFQDIFEFSQDDEKVTVLEGVTLASEHGVISADAGLQRLSATIDGALVGKTDAPINALGASISVLVGFRGSIESETGGPAAIFASGTSRVDNAGLISHGQAYAILFESVVSARVFNSDTIYGGGGGISVSSERGSVSAQFFNDGLLEAGGDKPDRLFGPGANQAYFSDARHTTVVNHGQIIAHDAVGAAINLTSVIVANQDETGAEINNDGDIVSDHYWAIDLTGERSFIYQSQIVNDGLIQGGTGAIRGGTGVDTVTNTGRIVGDVLLSGGSDYFDGSGGSNTGFVSGGDGDDHLSGNASANDLRGDAGDDTIRAGGGSDRLDGGAGADRMTGAGGGDVYLVDDANDRVMEADAGRAGGIDTVVSSISYTLGANVENLTLDGLAARGTGNGLSNLISGNAAANTLHGLAGDDTFQSGRGADILIGGLGNDVFRFAGLGGSTPAERDTITSGDGASAFENAGDLPGDRFDFSSIDANAGAAGIQHFTFGTSHGVAHLWAVDAGDVTLIRGNVGGGAAPEIEVAVADGAVTASAYTGADFLV